MTKEIRKINADIPVIICSGYSDGIQEKLSEFDHVGFLNKPIQSNILLEMINHNFASTNKI